MRAQINSFLYSIGKGQLGCDKSVEILDKVGQGIT